MIRYNISYRSKDGLRVLLGPNQGRFFKDTQKEAEEYLRDFLENNSADDLAELYGPQALGTFCVDAFVCYVHGDAMHTVVDEGPKNPCPRCGVMHPADRYIARPELGTESMPHGVIMYWPPDVTCSCGAVLRYTTSSSRTNRSSWMWSIVQPGGD